VSVVCIQFSTRSIRFVSDSRGTFPDGSHIDGRTKLFGSPSMLFSATGVTCDRAWQPCDVRVNAAVGEQMLLYWSQLVCEKTNVEFLTAFAAKFGSIHTAWLAGIDQQGKRWLRGINTSIENGQLKHTHWSADFTAKPQLVCSGGSALNLLKFSDPREFVKAAIALGGNCGGEVQETTI
jgi:hypothetical protein